MAYLPTPERVIERALSHIVIVGECWHSTYALSRGGGMAYPRIGWKGEDGKTRMRSVHRVTWESENGPIPDDMTVDHMGSVCIGPPCVRPIHLRLLTNFENARRHGGRDWPLGFCPNGHPNSELRWNGFQMACWPCKQERDRNYQRNLTARRRAALTLG